MSGEYESAREKIQKLREWYRNNEAPRNEATTRLHLIDDLLFECLGWDKKADCITEERINGTYTDYTLSCPNRTIIVEAKREHAYFDIPPGFSNREYKISTLTHDIPELGNAIKQAAKYCQERGTPFGVVTNGHQMVVFLGSRQDGVPPEEGRAIVFESLDAMVDNFLLFWKLLSKPGIGERYLHKRLIEQDSVLLPQKLSQRIKGYPGNKDRNVIQTEMQILADFIFEDIIGAQALEEKFLTECYCQSGALSQYALISKALLADRYAALFPEDEKHPTLLSAMDKKGINLEIFAESISRRPILILGDVGVGKTIFFRHFIRITSRDLFEKAIVLYIDFGSKAAFAKDIQEFVIDEISSQLDSKYDTKIFEKSFVEGIYHVDIMNWEKGIYGGLKDTDPSEFTRKKIAFLDGKIRNSERYLGDAFGHIAKGRKQQVVIFLDNADQRDDGFQQKLFVMAQTMAANWPVTVFLALRPETFQRSKQAGTMSAYHLKAFTISPPRVDEVLRRRLQFGRAIADGEIPSSLISESVSIKCRSVSAFLSIIQASLEYYPELVVCLDNLSGGNIRDALEYVKKLIGSGHIDTQKILEKYEKTGAYFMRLHEFLRSIIFGDTIYYDSDSSPIMNVFEISTEDTREHFLRLILLGYIDGRGSQSQQHGFVEMGDVYKFAGGMGFMVQQIDNCLCTLCERRLLETTGRVRPIDKHISAFAIRITTIGAYHLHSLPRMFTYYDAMVTDTPILDSAFRQKILDVMDIHERLDRGRLFLQYLDECAKKMDLEKCGLAWPELVAAAFANVAAITENIDSWAYRSRRETGY
jgi:hypothetical protein